MASTVVITFNTTEVMYDDIVVTINMAGTLKPLTLRVRPQRSGTGTMSFVEDTGGQTDPDALTTTVNYLATSFRQAWNLDYKDTGSYSNLVASVAPNLNDVTITMQNEAWQFVDVTGSAVFDGDVSSSISNDPVKPTVSMTLQNYTATGTPCSTLNANFQTTGGTGVYDVFLDGVLNQSGVGEFWSIELPRGVYKNIRVVDSNGLLILQRNWRAYRKLLASDLTINVENTSSGAIIDISTSTAAYVITPLEFSLDGIDYQTSSNFTGIAAGTKTLYVKDKFGCVFQTDFLIDGATTLIDTICTISEINALRFAAVESGKKNHKNTLSYAEPKQYALPYYHRYRETDIIPTQFKTNAAYINIQTVDCNGVISTLNPIQETTNIGVQAKSTSTYFDTGNGRSAIYFGIVDLLDYTTDAVLETVDYGFVLPEFAKTIGQRVSVEGLGELKITAIGYSDTYEAFVAEFDTPYSGAPVTKKVWATYNIKPYEIYEFQIDMSSQPDLFQVLIELGIDSNTITKTFISEKIKRVEDNDRLLEIHYKHSKNVGDMNYQTGIQHLMLMEGYYDYKGEQKSDGYNGDKEYFVTENEIYDSQTFYFERLSSEMAHKLRLVLAHDDLYINGLKYRLSDEPDIKTDAKNNIKSFSVILKRGGEQFLDNQLEVITGSTDSDLLGGFIEASDGKSLILWTKQNG